MERGGGGGGDAGGKREAANEPDQTKVRRAKWGRALRWPAERLQVGGGRRKGRGDSQHNRPQGTGRTGGGQHTATARAVRPSASGRGRRPGGAQSPGRPAGQRAGRARGTRASRTTRNVARRWSGEVRAAEGTRSAEGTSSSDAREGKYRSASSSDAREGKYWAKRNCYSEDWSNGAAGKEKK